jgi:hypothetical protein
MTLKTYFREGVTEDPNQREPVQSMRQTRALVTSTLRYFAISSHGFSHLSKVGLLNRESGGGGNKGGENSELHREIV